MVVFPEGYPGPIAPAMEPSSSSAGPTGYALRAEYQRLPAYTLRATECSTPPPPNTRLEFHQQLAWKTMVGLMLDALGDLLQNHALKHLLSRSTMSPDNLGKILFRTLQTACQTDDWTITGNGMEAVLINLHNGKWTEFFIQKSSTYPWIGGQRQNPKTYVASDSALALGGWGDKRKQEKMWRELLKENFGPSKVDMKGVLLDWHDFKVQVCRGGEAKEILAMIKADVQAYIPARGDPRLFPFEYFIIWCGNELCRTKKPLIRRKFQKKRSKPSKHWVSIFI